MSIRALIRAIQHLLSHTSRLTQRITKKIVTGFLRNLLLVGRRPRMSRAGFVLPTTVLLLLVATLTIGSITYRTYTRTAQTIGDRQQRVIYNAATPAIDRARAKLEFLFDPQKDPRFPGGIPGEGRLAAMLLNNGSNGVQALPGQDVYTLPDETRVDINGAGGVDNAWSYRVDTDEDGVDDATVAYSILFQIPGTGPNPGDNEQPLLTDSTDAAVRERARKLQVRRGPLSSVDQLNNACRRQAANTLPEAGWIPDGINTSTLRKNFQIDAFVLPDRPTGTVTTLEFYQDREVKRGNKWGAWFRNDLEIFPGAVFNWNGAMHTEGSLIVGKPQGALYNSYLISSQYSCLNTTKDASEVSVAEIEAVPAQGITPFIGQIISGRTGTNEFEDGSRFHLFNGAGAQPTFDPNNNDTKLLVGTDSIGNNSGAGGPADRALDPVALLTRGVSEARNGNSVAPQDTRWENTQFFQKGRILNKTEQAPYLDDSFRADNRYGPKPRYDNKKLPDGISIGAPITGNLMAGNPSQLPDTRLTTDVPAVSTDATSVGLDGYWERRARAEGLRLIVGQRLELGNPYPGILGGYDPTSETSVNRDQLPVREPLRPWKTCSPNVDGNTRCNEARQRRTLIDNLAAVQATAVYHYANPSTAGGPDFPLACLATTAHPGTSVTLDRSTTFEDLALAAKEDRRLDASLLTVTDFFSGRGTNGWEYEPPAAAGFPSAEMTKALKNLAYFAGDPKGGAPSFPPVQDTDVHPYPSMAMWGDFSVLRRILDSRTPYDQLSPADKTTMHTAACALGMLAYNMNYLSGYDYATPNPNLNALATKLGQLSRGNGTGGIVVTQPSPEAYIDGLRKWRDARGPNDAERSIFDKIIPLAELVVQKEQVERDRRHGFRVAPSPNCATRFTNVNGGQIENLSFLCSSQPKFPILFSLFPGDTSGDNVINAADNHGDINQNQPTRDAEDRRFAYSYITSVNPASPIYEVVDLTAIQLRPRQIASWVTPTETVTPNLTTASNNRDTLIKVCVTETCYRNASVGSLVRVAFKDSGMFNAREMMSVRVLDVNLDLLRRIPYRGDYWLPASGVVYAFREDAVSENSIVRPSSGGSTMQGTGTAEARDAKDPPLSTYNISPKPVDYSPDPDRRPHGFRLRRGAALWRGTALSRPGDNGRGLSFISDDPVYIQGNFNLHQNAAGTPLEEFQDPLPDDFTPAQFYNRRNINTNFAALTTDQWRPSEILADGVTILSDNFCDGSIEDGIITAELPNPSGANLSTLLDEQRTGENGSVYGCLIDAGTAPQQNVITSYLNQNRPNKNPPAATVNRVQTRWLRVNPYDQGSPILISRSGNPSRASASLPSIVENEYGYAPADGQSYYPYPTDATDEPLNVARANTRVNSIIISGIPPSRVGQSYGGMHNFPRLLENWRDKKLYIAGSFLQLNFSNYATGPYDQDAFEVGSATRPDSNPDGELADYYYPPIRVWGYDVGLQYAPAGPIAQRFVTFASIRSEFYDEPPANDPYISNLCRAINAARCPA
ncbi:hypothetical protein H6F88_07995 [Oculatella sp. FACHB-28]|uniref:hormogonium polysaccharide biosynthesis protein HpsA n=1 Tax=Oculatella sp. FACHB-28 TaxID=2692845 RepID=UPI0016839CC7|nr:hormogonium polysaccharide biosynthesis protein HpsA [Oculatella sp. FACHB-28]MBD2055960.1 hypothetical protein [Oculatella sp. FACHB-28]